ncbi:MAG: c-type cytochrome biogenesis protein CcmI [Methylohalobius sp.]|nr:c-type cytochrome biogenesis protein CcmI [Methylohalobius sp.]
MIAFWLVASGLVLLAYGLFWWSLRRLPNVAVDPNANLVVHNSRLFELEQELAAGKLSHAEFTALAAELEQELRDLPARANPVLNERLKGATAIAATLAVLPMLALGLYFGLGRPDLLGAKTEQAQIPASLEAGIQRLEQRLAQNPNDLEGWLLLGRSYQALARPEPAKAAYERALALAPNNLDVKARYAEALADLQGGIAGQPQKLLEEILAADPNHPYALWLSGLAALHEGDREKARAHWQKLLAQMPPASPAAEQLRQVMAKAGLSSDVQPTSPSHAQVQVTVQLAPDLNSRVRPEDPVFIFARASEGPPMPLAIVRRQVKDLPLTVTLDDTSAMLPQLKLSNFKRVVLGARIAKSGQAQGAPGDLEGWTSEILVGEDTPKVIVIDRVRS